MIENTLKGNQIYRKNNSIPLGRMCLLSSIPEINIALFFICWSSAFCDLTFHNSDSIYDVILTVYRAVHVSQSQLTYSAAHNPQFGSTESYK